MTVSRYGRAAMRRETERLELSGDVPTLFSSACALGELVAGGEIEHDSAYGMLIAMARTLKFDDGTSHRNIIRGLDRGKQHPRRCKTSSSGTVLKDRHDVVELAMTAWHGAQATVTGRSRAVILRILAGALLRCMAWGTTEISFSYRELSNLSGVSTETIIRHRPVWNRWFTRVVNGGPSGLASTWRLVNNAASEAVLRQRAEPTAPVAGPDTLRNAYAVVTARGLGNPAHNYWHRRSARWLLWCSLDTDEPKTAVQLAADTGLSVGGIRRSLKIMAEDGVVTSQGDGEWLSIESEPACPVDWAAKRKERWLAERQRFNFVQAINQVRSELGAAIAHGDEDEAEWHQHRLYRLTCAFRRKFGCRVAA